MNNENITARIEAYVGLVNDLIVIEEASMGTDRYPELHNTAFVRTGKKIRESRHRSIEKERIQERISPYFH